MLGNRVLNAVNRQGNDFLLSQRVFTLQATKLHKVLFI